MIYSREVEEMCPVAQGVHHLDEGLPHFGMLVLG